MPHCSQGVGLGSLPRLCARTASQTPSVLTSTSVCRDCQPGPHCAHFHVRVQGLPARPPACSFPSLCAGTASQAPSVLTSTSVCRDCQPRPQRAHFQARVQGLPARPPTCSLPRLCAGTASQGPSMLTSTSRDCQPGPQHAPSPSSPAFPSEFQQERKARAPGMKSRRNEPLTFNAFLKMQPGDLDF